MVGLEREEKIACEKQGESIMSEEVSQPLTMKAQEGKGGKDLSKD